MNAGKRRDSSNAQAYGTIGLSENVSIRPATLRERSAHLAAREPPPRPKKKKRRRTSRKRGRLPYECASGETRKVAKEH